MRDTTKRHDTQTWAHGFHEIETQNHGLETQKQ